MKTGDFLELFMKKRGRVHTSKVHGWEHATFRGLAELTSYLVFSCDFDEKGCCKARRYPRSDKDGVDQMCCCGGCRPCIGFHYQMPADYNIIKLYAQHFDEKTGFWRKGTGCALPRLYRSSTCLTYNCDPNYCRPDSHKHLLKCLRGKNNNMIVDGKESTEHNIVVNLKRWLKAPPTYKTAQGSIDYAP